uniref:Uncharacterized protein n=1 Tax=Romanomermis culicivorax TaxID=13658 RepID=A0A915K219_ROMCU
MMLKILFDLGSYMGGPRHVPAQPMTAEPGLGLGRAWSGRPR